MLQEKDVFEKKIKPALLYVGTLGAILSAVVYIITMIVMIMGVQCY